MQKRNSLVQKKNSRLQKRSSCIRKKKSLIRKRSFSIREKNSLTPERNSYMQKSSCMRKKESHLHNIISSMSLLLFKEGQTSGRIPEDPERQKYFSSTTCFSLLVSETFALSNEGGPNAPIALLPNANPSFGIPTIFESSSPFSFSS